MAEPSGIRRWLLRGLMGCLVAVICLWFGGRWYVGQSVMSYQGSVNVNGIDDKVRIDFDAFGIPHIWSQSDADAWFALGWLHASERLFQMEMMRRIASGRLSEVFGEDTLEMDVFHRRLGFARKARADALNLDDESLKLLHAYASGINTVQTDHPLPPECQILRLRPEPWRVDDFLAIGLYQSWFSHELMGRDQHYDRLIDLLGADIETILEAFKTWSPPTVPQATIGAFMDGHGHRMTRASNSWVVAPSKAASGHAMHASDPHLAINQVPGLWYAAGIHSEDGLNLVGVTCPGLPFLAMGHNGHIAWAFTVSSVDIIDYVRFPHVLNQESGIDHQHQIKRTLETILVGDEPRSIELIEVDGFVVLDPDQDQPLALKWAGHDFDAGDLFRSAQVLHRSREFQGFRQAVTGFGALDANWTYSDRQGNIGYQLGVPIPIRNNPHSFRVGDGDDLDNRWQGYRTLDDTPHAFNPKEGWIASCNNQPVADQWAYQLPGFYDPYRIVHLSQWLNEADSFDWQAFADMQLSVLSGVALRWKSLLVEGAERTGDSALAHELTAWDGSMSVDSQQAAIFALWWQHLPQFAFKQSLDDRWQLGRVALEEVLTAWNQSQSGDLVAVSAECLEHVRPLAEGKSYGDITTLDIKHPLSVVPGLDQWLDLNRGPIRRGGDNGSLNASFRAYSATSQRFNVGVGASMRFILDWVDPDQFHFVLQLGQSGHPSSPHYDDFLPLWEKGEYIQLPMTQEAVRARARNRLDLIPNHE